jgi:DeoR/GlpR family transcriptional regulator of sugar metabolism
VKQSREVVAARQDMIVSLLSDGAVKTTEELSRTCGVSVITIRRDLETLETKGLVERRRGGARIADNKIELQTYDEKVGSHSREKQLIARYIEPLIKSRSTVFLNSGTTVLEVAKRCKNKDITIITNSASVCDETKDGRCEVISTGGEYSPVTRSYVGDYATLILQKTFADICILGVNGVSATYGITTSSSREPMISEMMIKRCKGLKIIVATGSKIGKIHCFTSVPIEEIDMLVTDSSADSRELQKIRNLGVEVVLADKEVCD